MDHDDVILGKTNNGLPKMVNKSYTVVGGNGLIIQQGMPLYLPLSMQQKNTNKNYYF